MFIPTATADVKKMAAKAATAARPAKSIQSLDARRQAAATAHRVAVMTTDLCALTNRNVTHGMPIRKAYADARTRVANTSDALALVKWVETFSR
jgi:hypothetical protein